MTDLSERAAQLADWQQVVLNGGPPCFHFGADGELFCLRAERWAGHGEPDDVTHKFVSLADLLRSVRATREQAIRGAALAAAAEVADKQRELEEISGDATAIIIARNIRSLPVGDWQERHDAEQREKILREEFEPWREKIERRAVEYALFEKSQFDTGLRDKGPTVDGLVAALSQAPAKPTEEK